MEDETPRFRTRKLVVAGVATIAALAGAIGASAGISSATAADTSSTTAPTQQVQQGYSAPEGRAPGGDDCPERDGSQSGGQDESSTTPAPAPEL